MAPLRLSEMSKSRWFELAKWEGWSIYFVYPLMQNCFAVNIFHDVRFLSHGLFSKTIIC